MINLAKIGLSAALVIGIASIALAGEGSPDLSYPPGYEYSYRAPRVAAQPYRATRGGALDAYGWADESVRPFSAKEQRWFDQATGNVRNAP